MKFKVLSVIFDMDGVITDTMPYHMKAWRQVFHEAGLKVTHQDIYKREGQKGIDSVREIFAEYNIAFTEQIAHRLLLQKENLFKKIFKRRFISGSRLFIKSLHRQGFRLALVTGTSRHEAVQLLPKDLWDCFDVTVCGSDVHNGKPHPEPYLKALNKLGIKASEAVVIENAPFGIRSAKAARIRCVALATSLPKNYLKQADAIFPNFQKLKSSVVFEQ